MLRRIIARTYQGAHLLALPGLLESPRPEERLSAAECLLPEASEAQVEVIKGIWSACLEWNVNRWRHGQHGGDDVRELERLLDSAEALRGRLFITLRASLVAFAPLVG